MQTSAAMLLTYKYLSMQIQWAHCVVYLLIVCLFGLGANVSMTRKEQCLIKAKAIQTLQPDCLTLSVLTSFRRPWWESCALNFRCRRSFCSCGFEHTTIASACVVSENYYLLQEMQSQPFLWNNKLSGSSFKSLTNMFWHNMNCESICGLPALCLDG